MWRAKRPRSHSQSQPLEYGTGLERHSRIYKNGWQQRELYRFAHALPGAPHETRMWVKTDWHVGAGGASRLRDTRVARR